MKKWETTGRFWSAEMPERVLWGVAKFEPGTGVHIYLDGDLTSHGHPIANLRIPVLHGELFNGAQCTVFDCVCLVEIFYGRAPLPRTQVESKLLVSGGHWAGRADCLFHDMQLRFSHLDQWLDSPYSIRHNRALTRNLVDFAPETVISEFNFSGARVVAEVFCSRPLPTRGRPDGSDWSYRYSWSIRLDMAQSIDWHLSLAGVFREALAFAMGVGVFTLELVGFARPMAPGAPPRPMEIHQAVQIPRAIRYEEDLFSLVGDEKKILPRLLTAWFFERDSLELVQRTYSELLASDGFSPDSLFIRIVQTLEHFYGFIWPNESKYVSKSSFKELVSWLETNFPTTLEGMPSADQAALVANKSAIVGKFRAANGLTFQSRMERLFLSIPESTLYPIFDNPRDARVSALAFVKKVAITRNFHTHFDSQLREEKFSEAELGVAVGRCWAVLTFWIAHSLGLDAECASSMAIRSKDAMFLVRNSVPL